jgi:hypothetical protein
MKNCKILMKKHEIPMKFGISLARSGRQLLLVLPALIGVLFMARLLRMFRLMIMFASCSKIDKAHEWGTFPRCRAGLGYHIVLGPLILKYPPWGFTPHYSVNPNGVIL